VVRYTFDDALLHRRYTQVPLRLHACITAA
jgi:hypothetical protein